MDVDLNKEDLICLLRGYEPKISTDTCLQLEKQELMRFTGNQWNEAWEWNVSKLKTMSEHTLYFLYINLNKLNKTKPQSN